MRERRSYLAALLRSDSSVPSQEEAASPAPVDIFRETKPPDKNDADHVEEQTETVHPVRQAVHSGPPDSHRPDDYMSPRWTLLLAYPIGWPLVQLVDPSLVLA